MSSAADADEVVETADSGVTVRKSFIANDFPVPAIQFKLESEHDDPVSVRLSERIPDAFQMDAVGFHPDYHSDCWTAFQDNHVEFSGTVEPDEPLVTVYGIRIDDESRASEFLTEPTIDDVTPIGAEPTESETESEPVEDTMIDDIVPEDRNQVVKDMISGESDSVPGLEERADDEADAAEADDVTDADDLDLNLEDVDTDPVETGDAETDDEAPDIDLDFDENDAPEAGEAVDDESGATADEPKIELDLDAAAAATEAAADESSTSDSDGSSVSDAVEPETVEDAETEDDADAGGVSAEPGAIDGSKGPDALRDSIGARLVAEIRGGRLDDENLAVLREELAIEPSSSDLAKVSHLQRRVEEVAAYSNALEEFLDEEGTGAALIERFQERLASIESDITTVTDQLDENDARIDAVERTVDAIDSRVDSVESDLETLDDSVESDLDAIEEDVSGLDGSISHLEENVSELDDGLGATADDVAEVSEDLDGLEGEVGELEDDVEDLEGEVDDLEEDVAHVRDDITEIQEWRSELGSMFSGQS